MSGRLKRVIEKNGKLNILNELDKSFSVFHINFLDMHWYKFVTLFSSLHVLSFLFFSLVYLITDVYHKQGMLDPNSTIAECFINIESSLAFYQFAMETHQTIGYGTRGITANCPDAVMHLTVHILWGVLLSTIFSGLFLARFSKPGSGVNSIVFSRKAVITMRNGGLYLVFRIADTQDNGRDRGVRVTGLCFMDVMFENENFPLQIHHLDFGFQIDGSNDMVPLLYPICVSHKIDEKSPLYEIHPTDLESTKLEIIISVSGVRSETGTGIYASTSYTADEIIWGARFVHNRVLSRAGDHIYVDFSQLEVDRYETDDTPRMSAEQLNL